MFADLIEDTAKALLDLIDQEGQKHQSTKHTCKDEFAVVRNIVLEGV